jgi:RnfABCDGE-type electron transport complex B subunit
MLPALAATSTGYLISTPLTLLVIGLFFAIVLTIANSRLRVAEDPRVVAVREATPGANCGGCGYPGCEQFAEAVVTGKALPADCVVASAAAVQAISAVMGLEATTSLPKRAVVHCAAKSHERLNRTDYLGAHTCVEMNVVACVQGCTHGCLGLGDCVRVCPFEAIMMIDGLPVVNYKTCTGCGNCVDVCPRGIITIEEMTDDPLVVVACNSKDPGKYVRANCKVGCIACGMCAKLDGDVFEMKENLPAITYDAAKYGKTESHAKAAEKCPTACLLYVGTEIRDPHELIEHRAREKAAKAAAKAAAQKAAAKTIPQE